MSETDQSRRQKFAPPTAAQVATTAETTDENLSPVDGADWFSLARKLRQRNRELLKRVADLESSMAQMQDEFSTETDTACPSANLVNSTRNEELLQAQAHTNLLFQELEAAHNVAQRQLLIIENLSEQLEAAQAQIAQLERECLRTKQRCAEQAQLLQQATDNSQTLSHHLRRQQEQTAQVKIILDRYLNVPSRAAGAASTPASESLSGVEPTALETENSVIKPWSASPQAPKEPPTWAIRLLRGEVTLPPPAPSFSQAEPGKFANLMLPDFNEPAAAVAPAPLVEIRRRSADPAPAPILSVPAATNRKLSSIAAVDLPTFPRQR